jgi:hypothetical protein
MLRRSVTALLWLVGLGLGEVAVSSDAVRPTFASPLLERVGDDPQVRVEAGRALSAHAEDVLADGGLASGWLLASAAARFDEAHEALAATALAKWTAAHAVRIQVAPGSSEEANSRLVSRLRAQVDGRLVRWVEEDQALISGVVGRTTEVCSQQRVGARTSTFAGVSYTIETWERTCTVGIVGSLRVGNRPYVLNFEFSGSIEGTAWEGNPSVGLVGRPLRFDESEAAMVAQIDEALATRAASAIDAQARRLLREVLLPDSPDPLEERATTVLLGYLAAGKADEAELLATAQQLMDGSS